MATVAQATDRDAPANAEPDDVDAYIATFDDDERGALAAAEAAIDIAILLHRARERRGLSQAAAAELAGPQQQAVSRFERPAASPQLETIQEYLGALGYGVEVRASDLATGEAAATAMLPQLRPKQLSRPRPPARPGGRADPSAETPIDTAHTP